MKIALWAMLLLGTQDSVDELIDQLGAGSIIERGESEEQLADLGWKVVPALRKAAKGHDDLEIRARAAVLVKQITSVPWTQSIDDALQKAKRTKKRILVFSTGGDLNGYV